MKTVGASSLPRRPAISICLLHWREQHLQPQLDTGEVTKAARPKKRLIADRAKARSLPLRVSRRGTAGSGPSGALHGV